MFLPCVCTHVRTRYVIIYGGRPQTSWHYRKNLDYYNRALLEKSKTMKFTIVPMYINLDTENNYPVQVQPVNQGNPKKVERQNNGVHPAKAGYYQMGDTLYCWIKARLARQENKMPTLKKD